MTTSRLTPNPATKPKMILRHIFISPGHNYFGHHGQAPGEHPMVELEQVECIPGRGLKGDRFFDYRDDYKGQLTLFSWEIFLQLREEQHKPDLSPSLLRRNLVVEGADLARLIGTHFELQGVRLEGVEECRPCYWMDQAIAGGTETWLTGRGGLRCRILSPGTLRREQS